MKMMNALEVTAAGNNQANTGNHEACSTRCERRRGVGRPLGCGLLLAVMLIASAGCTVQRPVENMRSSGDFHFEQGQFDQAAREYAGIIDRYPGDWEAQYRYGLTQLEMNNNAEARQALEIAYTRRPNNPDIADALAEAMFRLDDHDRLFSFLRERAESTQSVRAYLRMGRYSMAMGDNDSARKAISTAIALNDGQSVEPYLLAADLAERLGDIDQAVRHLTIAYHVDRNNQTVVRRLRNLGEIPGPTLGTADASRDQP